MILSHSLNCTKRLTYEIENIAIVLKQRRTESLQAHVL